MNREMGLQKHETLNTLLSLLNFKVLEFSQLLCKEPERYEASSPFNRLYLVTDGSGEITPKNGSKLVLSRGNIYLLPAGLYFNYRFEIGLRMHIWHFNLELLTGQDLFELSRMPQPRRGEFNSLLQTSRKLAETPTNAAALIDMQSKLFSTVSAFIDPELDINHNADLIRRYQHLFQLVQQHCSAQLKVKTLAEKLKCPASTLSRRFREDCGRTLKDFLTERLIQKSIAQLLISDASIKEIAYGLEFSDEFYFSRFIRKHTGKSPREYRQRFKSIS